MHWQHILMKKIPHVVSSSKSDFITFSTGAPPLPSPQHAPHITVATLGCCLVGCVANIAALEEGRCKVCSIFKGEGSFQIHAGSFKIRAFLMKVADLQMVR